MAPQKWVVVGGGGKGILARQGKDTSSAEEGKLATGALIEELERSGDRLKYKKLRGAGPSTGWVSVKAQGKDLCKAVVTEEGGKAAEALTKVVAGEFSADDALGAFKGLKDKSTIGAGALITAVPDLFLKANQPEAAVVAGQDAVAHFKSLNDTVGLATAQGGLATAYFHQQEYEKAKEAAEAALSTFTELGDKEAQASVMHTLVGINLVSSHKEDAQKLAKDATQLFKAVKDFKGLASALVLEAEVYIECSRLEAAAGCAKEAAALFAQIGDKKQEAAALIMLAFAELNKEYGSSIEAAEKAVALYKELGEKEEEAGAMYAVANAHLSAISIKQRHCLLPSQENTLGALTAGKAAYDLFVQLRNEEGQQSAMVLMQNALGVNGIQDMGQEGKSPEEWKQILDEKNKATKKDDKDKKDVYNRAKFAWRDATIGFHYHLLWEHQVENLGMRRGGYKAVMMGNAERSAALPMYQCLKTYFNQASTDEGPIAVHLGAANSSWSYATTIMNNVAVVSTMMTCRMNKFVFMQLNEAPPDAEEWESRIRQVSMAPVTLGILRSARLENPSVVCGYIALDTPTWNNNRLEVIQSLPDTLQTEESELMYHRGVPLSAALVSQTMDQPVDFVKTAKMARNLV